MSRSLPAACSGRGPRDAPAVGRHSHPVRRAQHAWWKCLTTGSVPLSVVTEGYSSRGGSGDGGGDSGERLSAIAGGTLQPADPHHGQQPARVDRHVSQASARERCGPATSTPHSPDRRPARPVSVPVPDRLALVTQPRRPAATAPKTPAPASSDNPRPTGAGTAPQSSQSGSLGSLPVGDASRLYPPRQPGYVDISPRPRWLRDVMYKITHDRQRGSWPAAGPTLDLGCGRIRRGRRSSSGSRNILAAEQDVSGGNGWGS